MHCSCLAARIASRDPRLVPTLARFIRRTDHRAVRPMPLVDDVKEYVRHIGANVRYPTSTRSAMGRSQARRRELYFSARPRPTPSESGRGIRRGIGRT